MTHVWGITVFTVHWWITVRGQRWSACQWKCSFSRNREWRADKVDCQRRSAISWWHFYLLFLFFILSRSIAFREPAWAEVTVCVDLFERENEQKWPKMSPGWIFAICTGTNLCVLLLLLMSLLPIWQVTNRPSNATFNSMNISYHDKNQLN